MFYLLPETETKKKIYIENEDPDSQGLLSYQHEPTVKSCNTPGHNFTSIMASLMWHAKHQEAEHLIYFAERFKHIMWSGNGCRLVFCYIVVKRSSNNVNNVFNVETEVFQSYEQQQCTEQLSSTVLLYRSPKAEAVARVASRGTFLVFPFGDLAMPMLTENCEPA